MLWLWNLILFDFFVQDDNNKIEIVFIYLNIMYEYKEVFNLFDKEIKIIVI